MRLHALNGDRAAVRRTFQTLASTLQRELGIAPASATQEAYTQLLSMETKQPFAIMVIESPEWRPRPLPIPPTPFIGREAELAEIAELLANPGCRLLTILGQGGMGKSRLALQTAVGHQTIFADGIAYASLATLDSSELIIPTLVEALNFTLASLPDPASQLLNFLRQKEILLVLDNLDHLLDGVCLLAEILAQVPGSKILITSRQRLDLQEEWVYAVHGLPLPDECGGEGIEENSSVLLFMQSARRSRHSFVLTEANCAPIVRICHLVDGLPLGLELAASWVHSLSCAEIANEIERDLDFLTVSTRNIAERHRSIRAVFDYSWQLLSLEEQQILKRLSLFDTSFSRESVEEVAGISLVQLLSLVDKSLIHRIDKNRYHLPEFFRRFVAALLPEVLQEEYALCICVSKAMKNPSFASMSLS
jgi:predicted ATPase